MNKHKISLLAYGLLIVSVLGVVADRRSKTLSEPFSHMPLRVEQGPGDDDDDETSIITTRFLFPEDPNPPLAFQ